MKDSVSIIIPAFNEEENIPLAISSVKKARHSNAITAFNIKRSTLMIVDLLHDIYFH